jgi:hypothetical protein
METLIALFGEGKDLDSLQMAARATVVFFGALILIRISGRRSFGQRSPFDYVVAILLGATLSRVIVGAGPRFEPIVCAPVKARVGSRKKCFFGRVGPSSGTSSTIFLQV